MLKKIYNTVIAIILMGITIGYAPLIVHADTTADQFLHSFTPGAGTADTSKIGIVGNIAKNTTGSWQTILTGVIKFVLSITGALAFIAFTYAGIMMVTARGNEEQIKKGKDVLVWSIIALAIIAVSYALVLGVSQLQFTTP